MRKSTRPRPALLILLLTSVGLGFATQPARAADDARVVRVMSFNLWHGGDAGKQPLDQTVAVIQRARADLVGLQETAGFAPKGQARPDRAAEIAKKLGWHYFDQGDRTGIISRFKIVSNTPRKWGVKLELPTGRYVYHFNAHLAHSPYQPYQLLGIPYGNAPFLKTADEAVKAAREARGGQVERMLAEVKAILSEGAPVFLTGDFNEPSHLDWTAEAAKAKLCPLDVPWPSTKAVVDAGFTDVYRAVHPDPIAKRGLTWTPTTKTDDPKDRHDRIDFVFAHDAATKVKSVAVVGESNDFADVAVSPYPSDHRAVVAEIELPPAIAADRLIVCGGSEVYIVLANGPPPDADKRLWRWTATDSPEIPVELRKRFRTTDECKPFGDAILITSSGGGVALVRRRDKKALFHASVRNAHSACLLPDRRVAVASSYGGNELLIFDLDRSGSDAKPLARLPLHGAHGAIWDSERKRLWTLGEKELLLVDVQGLGIKTQLVVDKRFGLPTSGGHDLTACRNERDLLVTTESQVYRFDKRTGRFEPLPGSSERTHWKSAEEHPKTGALVYHQATDKAWWSDTIRFLDPARNLQLAKERIYKVRWDVPRPIVE